VIKVTEKTLMQIARKTPNGIVKVKELPKCDFCDRTAVVDGKTVFGPWAYMCIKHYQDFGVGLGLGKGQVLVVED
jgi:hypothetical protein